MSRPVLSCSRMEGALIRMETSLSNDHIFEAANSGSERIEFAAEADFDVFTDTLACGLQIVARDGPGE
jgi:hypothetical protein